MVQGTSSSSRRRRSSDDTLTHVSAVSAAAHCAGAPPPAVQVLFEAQGRTGRQKAVDLEDVRFHQCVRLARFDNDRTISFVPPDGAFDLMSYRLSQNIKCDNAPPTRALCWLLWQLLYCCCMMQSLVRTSFLLPPLLLPSPCSLPASLAPLLSSFTGTHSPSLPLLQPTPGTTIACRPPPSLHLPLPPLHPLIAYQATHMGGVCC